MAKRKLTRRQALAEAVEFLSCCRGQSPVLGRAVEMLTEAATNRASAPLVAVIVALESALPRDREICAATLLLRDQLPDSGLVQVAKLAEEVRAGRQKDLLEPKQLPTPT